MKVSHEACTARMHYSRLERHQEYNQEKTMQTMSSDGMQGEVMCWVWRIFCKRL